MRYAGRMQLDPKPTPLHPMLEESGGLLCPAGPLAPRPAPRPPAGPRPAELVASIDERQMKQAVLNLMINALQAMPEQGGEILLSATRDGGRVRIEVTDTGRGIEPEALDRIFQAYYSTKKGGTGLGLAIASASPKNTAGGSARPASWGRVRRSRSTCRGDEARNVKRSATCERCVPSAGGYIAHRRGRRLSP